MVIPLKATLSKNVNIVFRLKNKTRKILHARKDAMNIPIIINNYNRFSYLCNQLDWLEKAGYKNIHIIDNSSTYPPLLKYYQKLKYPIYMLDRNIGHEALWRTHIYQRFMHDYYVYTDPDIVPIAECPHDILAHYLELFQKYPDINKIGIGLKIDDLPDCYHRKQEVIEWETPYWQQKVGDNEYLARTDTTFALYRPGIMFQQWDKTIRTGYPYIARHLPWYEDSSNPSEEDTYFTQKTTRISSWFKEGKYEG